MAKETLHFGSEEELRIAIISTLVPVEVLADRALAWRGGKGELYVQPAKALPAATLKKLKGLGIGTVGTVGDRPSGDAREASCWAEILGFTRDVEDLGEGTIVFWIADGEMLLAVAGELLRLGCDRQELRSVGDGYLLRVSSPPFYTLARAMDHVDGLRAFAPWPRGQDRVFIEVGFAHPLASLLRPSPGTALFLSPDRPWVAIADAVWSDVYSIVELSVPSAAVEHAAASRPPRLAVKLRLSRGGRSESASLWVLREGAVAKIEALLASVPEEVASGLQFAVVGDKSEPMVILRSRPGRRAPVAAEIDGEAFKAHAQVANLFVPCDAVIEPPLRRDRIRELLAPDPAQITWLQPTGDNSGDRDSSRTDQRSFVPERLRDDAFRPLSDWVEYVVDASAQKLVPWVRSATFDFDAFEGLEPERIVEHVRVAHGEENDKERAKREPGKTRTARTATRATMTPRGDAPAGGEARRVLIVAEELQAAPLAEALGATEKEFLALQAPADDPRRQKLWRTLAELNARLAATRDPAALAERARFAKDAGLCWTRAIWDLDGDEARVIAEAWSSAESREPADLLAISTPSREDVRAVASILVRDALAGAASVDVDVNRAGVWLDRHDEALDIRSTWLARTAISRLVGSDALGLARARDRLLAKLHRGLSVERDVPTFLRFVGGAREGAQVDRIFGALKELLARFEKAKRSRSSVEADPKNTLAYVLFVFAYGAARLGQTDHARELVLRANSLLDLDEPIHGFLARAYAVRVAHAMEGLPPETPLSPDVAARLNSLDKLSRYKVDRVRQFSLVLEPQERLSPIDAFQRGEADPRGPEFAELRGMSDPSEIERAVDAIMTKALAAPPEDRARLFDGVMDFFPSISVARAQVLLDRILATLDGVAPARRAQLLEEALMLAGHFGDEELVRRIFATLEPLLAGLGGDHAAEVAQVIGGMLRTLRRVGLRTEASKLLETMQSAAKGKGTSMLIARLHAASGLSYLGGFESARRVFEETLAVLEGEVPTPERLEITRTLARALGHAPHEYAVVALGKMGDKLKVVTDSFNTNSHVCLSVVAFMEALVLGYASEDLAIGEQGRQWLDDDEYLIRRRIHHDTIALEKRR